MAERANSSPIDAQAPRCSFCNKSSDQVRKIIAGRTASICDECVEVCDDIVGDETSSRTAGFGYGAPTKPITRIRCALCGVRKPYDDSVLMLRHGALCASCVSDVGWAVAQAGSGRMTAMDSDNRQQALALYEQLLRGWNDQNAEAFSAVFAEDGSAVGFDGSMMNGRQEIAATLRGIFEHHRTATYVAKVREVRELGGDVVLLRAVVGMRPPESAALNPAVNAIQSVVMKGQSQTLRVTLLQSTPAAFHGRPELADQLTRELTEVLHTGRVVVA
jgi:uncharacterized protein (TIGR02246 family)